MLFFDTNILVYTQDPGEPVKQALARALVHDALASGLFTISTQVMQEFYAVTTRRQLLSAAQAEALLRVWGESPVVLGSPELVLRAVAMQQSRQMSVWDALIVQAALDGGCARLYSEDLQHGARFGTLVVTNPFAAPAVHEPLAAYAPAPAGRRSRVTRYA
jgi:predicted nucleic acid-binding protein